MHCVSHLHFPHCFHPGLSYACPSHALRISFSVSLLSPSSLSLSLCSSGPCFHPSPTTSCAASLFCCRTSPNQCYLASAPTVQTATGHTAAGHMACGAVRHPQLHSKLHGPPARLPPSSSDSSLAAMRHCARSGIADPSHCSAARRAPSEVFVTAYSPQRPYPAAPNSSLLSPGEIGHRSGRPPRTSDGVSWGHTSPPVLPLEGVVVLPAISSSPQNASSIISGKAEIAREGMEGKAGGGGRGGRLTHHSHLLSPPFFSSRA